MPFSLEELGLSPDEIAALEAGTSDEPAASAAPAAEESELMPFSLEELGLSPDEIAALESGAATGETIIPGWSKNETPNMEPFAESDSSLEPPASEPDMGEPFSFDDFGAEEPTPSETAAESARAEFEGLDFDENVQPFSLDDLGLSDFDLGTQDSSRELGLTADELAGMDLGEFETLMPGAASSQESDEEIEQVDTGDPALDKLIMLGRRQGFVDLTDIIGVVDDPEAEAERIEEIGWTLHRAGIQIRDGDEIIDMEADEAEEPEVAATLTDEFEEFSTASADDSTFAEPELTPFSLEELGLSPEEIAALGLSEADATFAPEPAAPTPAAEPPAPKPAAPPTADLGEPELTPFSLEELGLTAEEIAALGLNEADAIFAPEPVAPATPEPEPAPPAASSSPPIQAEPELAPFSLEELGLSPEEIAALGFNEANATLAPEPTAAARPEPEPATEPPAAEEDDMFDFGFAEEQQVERAVRTTPREAEPPPTSPVEDNTFVPADLDNLDDIWDAPPPVEPEAPARVVLPAMSERAKTPPQRQGTTGGTSGGRTPPADP
ncbi:MAG: hypothetical protein HC822_17210 [Oscillochloris sp.]|nr:hypothetical protein [Oscillochloris sp.]